MNILRNTSNSMFGSALRWTLNMFGQHLYHDLRGLTHPTIFMQRFNRLCMLIYSCTTLVYSVSILLNLFSSEYVFYVGIVVFIEQSTGIDRRIYCQSIEIA